MVMPIFIILPQGWIFFSSKTISILEKKLTLQELKFLRNLFFDFHEIQHLSGKRPIFLYPKAQPLAQTYLISASNLVIFWCFFKVKGHK